MQEKPLPQNRASWVARCHRDEQVWWVDDLGTFRAVDKDSDDLWRSQPIGEDERSHRLAFRLMQLVKIMEGHRHLTVQWDACCVDETALQAAVTYVKRRQRDLRAVHLRYCVGAWIDECSFSGSLAAARMEQILGLRGATPFIGMTVRERPLEQLGSASRPLRHGFDAWRRLCWQHRLPAADHLIDALAPDLRFAAGPTHAPLIFWHTAGGPDYCETATEDLWNAFLDDLPGHLDRTLTPTLRNRLLQDQKPRFDHVRLPFTWPEKEAYWFCFARLILPVRRADGRTDLMTLCVPTGELDIPTLENPPSSPSTPGRAGWRNPLDRP